MSSSEKQNQWEYIRRFLYNVGGGKVVSNLQHSLQEAQAGILRYGQKLLSIDKILFFKKALEQMVTQRWGTIKIKM